MTPAEAWIRGRLGDAPPALLAEMIGALPADASLPIPAAMGQGAHSLLATLSGEPRSEALPLLAADALLTHAFAAQAELDPDGIAALAERWGAAGALGEMAAR
ncbi:MAG TPA: hypothetical protein VF665_03160 [Longimicrobium sp.]|uniref:hypothetical protein n=1 Tax=Longimicrobium sp. TaxID=2029185 RepID=UPI002ED86582